MDYNTSLLQHLCPNCHYGTLRECYIPIYQHHWNKCKSCGYMELKSVTLTRITKLIEDTPDEGVTSKINVKELKSKE